MGISRKEYLFILEKIDISCIAVTLVLIAKTDSSFA